MGEVTHQQVDLMLKLYEIRREPVLREARAWYVANFHPTSTEDLARQAPMGSKQNAYVRMVLSYWEMAASIVNRGLIDEEFFFESTGEQWAVWESVRPIIAAWRAGYGNTPLFTNLETHVQHLEAWRERRAPGANDAIRKMLAQRAAAATPKRGKKK
jgi:ribonuclease D